MALKVLAWDTVNKRRKVTTYDAGGSAATSRSQSVALTNATTSVAITFSSAMSDANYVLVCTMKNLIDSYPQIQPIVITAQDAAGFTAKWNAALDSGNYKLDYFVTTYS